VEHHLRSAVAGEAVAVVAEETQDTEGDSVVGNALQRFGRVGDGPERITAVERAASAEFDGHGVQGGEPSDGARQVGAGHDLFLAAMTLGMHSQRGAATPVDDGEGGDREMGTAGGEYEGGWEGREDALGEGRQPADLAGRRARRDVALRVEDGASHSWRT